MPSAYAAAQNISPAATARMRFMWFSSFEFTSYVLHYRQPSASTVRVNRDDPSRIGDRIMLPTQLLTLWTHLVIPGCSKLGIYSDSIDARLLKGVERSLSMCSY